MFDLKKEFDFLVKNGWLTKEETELFYNDEKMTSAIDLSTSPTKENIFNALKTVSVDDLKIVILGQDPYPNPKDAHGLAFSSKNNQTPESLKNIFKALDKANGTDLFNKGKNDLTNWTKSGVLLLNTSLTFQKNEFPKDDKKERDKIQQRLQQEHKKVWKPFINLIIKKILSHKNKPVIMMLWGNDAHNIVYANIKNKEFKTTLHERNAITVPETKIILLQTSHPSPLSVNRGGDFPTRAVEHFKFCNEYFESEKINWDLT